MDSRSFFIEVPIASQLNSLFNKEGFYDSLSYRFNREIKEGVMSDIYDETFIVNILITMVSSHRKMITSHSSGTLTAFLYSSHPSFLCGPYTSPSTSCHPHDGFRKKTWSLLVFGLVNLNQIC